MRPRNFEMFTDMVYFPDAIGRGIDSLGTIEEDSIVPPGRFPKLVHDGYILLGKFIAIIVLAMKH